MKDRQFHLLTISSNVCRVSYFRRSKTNTKGQLFNLRWFAESYFANKRRQLKTPSSHRRLPIRSVSILWNEINFLFCFRILQKQLGKYVLNIWCHHDSCTYRHYRFFSAQKKIIHWFRVRFSYVEKGSGEYIENVIIK